MNVIAKLGLDLGRVMSLVVDKTLGLVDAGGAAIELAEGDDMIYSAAAGSAETMPPMPPPAHRA